MVTDRVRVHASYSCPKSKPVRDNTVGEHFKPKKTTVVSQLPKR